MRYRARKSNYLILLILCVFPMLSGFAQYENKRERLTPEHSAQNYTSLLKAELTLTEKQSKKVYKLYLKQARKKESEMSGSVMREHPDSPSYGSGHPGAGMGVPPGRIYGGMPGSVQRPERTGEGEKPDGIQQRKTLKNVYQESKEDIEKCEKKMKKILDEVQYKNWQEIEKEKSFKEREQLRREEQKGLFPPYEKQ